jgi:chaperone required for assembly of F1-ATPase
LRGSGDFARCSPGDEGPVLALLRSKKVQKVSLPGHGAERRKRFYKKVDTAKIGGGFAVRLDGRTPRSPAGAQLILPTEALAELVAAEWAAQETEIIPATMPATQLAFAALAQDGAAAASRVGAFAGTDLLCYFAEGPAALVEQQETRWGPVIAWAQAELGVTFTRTQGLVHQPQPPETIARLEALAGAEPRFALAGLVATTALFGSAILAFALRRGQLSAEAAFALSRLDETFQEGRWGVDAEAAARAEAMAREATMLERWFDALETAPRPAATADAGEHRPG